MAVGAMWPAATQADTHATLGHSRISLTQTSQALAIDFHCLSRSEINFARWLSSAPPRMVMSSGSARQYTPDVRASTLESVSARVVQYPVARSTESNRISPV